MTTTKVPLHVVILAAGKGTRMQSSIPKVLHEVCGEIMLARVIEQARALKPKKIWVVVGKDNDLVSKAVKAKGISFVTQKKQDGTAGAALCACKLIPDKSVMLILFGDLPLLTATNLKRVVAPAYKNALSIRTMETKYPFGYSRIVRNQKNMPIDLVNEISATASQKKITEVDAGGMAMPASWGKKSLLKTKVNQNKERVMTELVPMAFKQNIKVVTVSVPSDEGLGVNTKADQLKAESILSKRIVEGLQSKGVVFADPTSVLIHGTLKAASGVFIDKNVVFKGKVVLAKNAAVGPNCVVIDSTLGHNASLEAFTLAENAVLEKDAIAGPFARLREGTVLKQGANVGNFVETKNVTLKQGVKAKHLSYLGDATIGANTNIGAGTVFANYDGKKKLKIKVGDKVFIGAGSMLIAPLEISDGAKVAAGSVITKNVPKDALAFGRAKQIVKNKSVKAKKRSKKTK